MCEKCEQLDSHIARCERLRDEITDKQFLEGLVDLLKSYLEEKLALHPEAI